MKPSLIGSLESFYRRFGISWKPFRTSTSHGGYMALSRHGTSSKRALMSSGAVSSLCLYEIHLPHLKVLWYGWSGGTDSSGETFVENTGTEPVYLQTYEILPGQSIRFNTRVYPQLSNLMELRKHVEEILDAER